MNLTPDATKYIDGVLTHIGAPVNSTTVTGMYTWLENEQGQGLSAFEANKGNPLGIQTPEAQAAGKSGDVNQAIANTAQLLSASYPNIVHAFKTATSPQEIATQIVNSPWNNGKSDGTGYGGLQSFMSGGGAGNASAAPSTTTGTTGTTLNANGAGGGFGNGPNAQGLPQNMVQGFNSTYTGPNAYKGFDLTSIAQSAGPEVMKQVKQAIDYYTSNPQLEQQMISDIYQAYGTEAWIANVPEIRTLLVAGTYNDWEKDPALFTSLMQDTNWYKTTAPSVRLWQENVANDPAAAQKAIQQASARVLDIANTLGVQLTQTQVNQIATQAAQSSIDATGTYVNGLWPDQNIIDAVKSDFNPTSFLGSVGGATTSADTTGANAPVTAQNSSGDAAALYNQFQTISRNYYLGLTPQQIASQVQQYISGDTGQGNFQSGAIAGFTSFAQNQARQMYPALSNSLGTQTSVGADNTPYQSTAWIRNMIAQYTGQGSGDNVDLSPNSPQWSWILSGKAPPAAQGVPGLLTASPNGNAPGTGTGALPSADDLQRYLMSTPQFQKTDAAKTMGWQVGASILKAFGYGA